MIVPQYWAEARIQQREDGKQITVRRYGWSDSSEADAHANAQQRAEVALARIRSGEKLPRRDLKIPYNGADGVPIREEILQRHHDVVITRNSYGAHCLNTPDVLFADVDFRHAPGKRVYTIVILFLLLTAIFTGWLLTSWTVGIVAFIVLLLFSSGIASGVQSLVDMVRGGVENHAKKLIDKFIAQHPDWHLRVYRTPAGYRLLVLHQLFDPAEQSVTDFFKALDVDPVYQRMCRNQRCFRARLTAKPWRIGISTHMRPRPGVWPIDPQRLTDRQRWVDEYEKVRQQYAACRFIGALGSNMVHPKAHTVQKLHDEQCGARSGLPIA